MEPTKEKSIVKLTYGSDDMPEVIGMIIETTPMNGSHAVLVKCIDGSSVHLLAQPLHALFMVTRVKQKQR